MVRKHVQNIVRLLSGLYLLEILAPLYMTCMFFAVRYAQQSAVSHPSNFSKSFCQIELSRDEFSRLTFYNKSEMAFGNQRYDIQSITFKKGKYYIIALPDTLENKIHSFTSAFVNHKGRQGEARLTLLVFPFQYCEPMPYHRPLLMEGPDQVFYHLCTFIHTPFIKIQSPPPDCC